MRNFPVLKDYFAELRRPLAVRLSKYLDILRANRRVSMMKRLAYTNPVNVPARWPNIVTNPFDIRHFRWYIQRYGDLVESIIYDSGVHAVFHGKRRLDYPPGYLSRYFSILEEVERLRRHYSPEAELLYVIPDVPADYEGRENLYPRNVEKTVEYILLFLKRYIRRLPGKPMPVVQGAKDRPASVVWSWIEYKDVYEEFELVALGNVCSSNRISLIAKELRLFDRITTRPYHAFGIHTRALRYLLERGASLCLLRSIDSSSYYYDWLYREPYKNSREALARALLSRMSTLQSLLDRIPCSAGRPRMMTLTELLSSGDLARGRQAPVRATLQTA
ncbi:MAG: hypothetical protein F7C35_06670 [Desulfurococcales archaeon]|nr:hypothetical protein [Desulfurococcales archaeon]